MTRSVEDVAREAAPFLAELIRKYPPKIAAVPDAAAPTSRTARRGSLDQTRAAS